jgi:hypothetical protein
MFYSARLKYHANANLPIANTNLPAERTHILTHFNFQTPATPAHSKVFQSGM